MLLEGSCQCGKVTFSVESETPYPYMFCYCSICRKTTGAVTCNVMGRRETLKVKGDKHLRVHHAVMRQKGKKPWRSEGERWFCGKCGSHLYLLDERWSYGVWPNAAAIDTPLPIPPEHVQLMTRYRPAWVPTVPDGPRFPEYPKLSIADWHEQHHLTTKSGDVKKARTPRKAKTEPSKAPRSRKASAKAKTKKRQ